MMRKILNALFPSLTRKRQEGFGGIIEVLISFVLFSLLLSSISLLYVTVISDSRNEGYVESLTEYRVLDQRLRSSISRFKPIPYCSDDPNALNAQVRDPATCVYEIIPPTFFPINPPRNTNVWAETGLCFPLPADAPDVELDINTNELISTLASNNLRMECWIHEYIPPVGEELSERSNLLLKIYEPIEPTPPDPSPTFAPARVYGANCANTFGVFQLNQTCPIWGNVPASNELLGENVTGIAWEIFNNDGTIWHAQDSLTPGPAIPAITLTPNPDNIVWPAGIRIRVCTLYKTCSNGALENLATTSIAEGHNFYYSFVF